MKKALLTLLLTTVISIPVFAGLTPSYFRIYSAIQWLSYIPKSGNIKGNTDIGAEYGIEIMSGKKYFSIQSAICFTMQRI